MQLCPHLTTGVLLSIFCAGAGCGGEAVGGTKESASCAASNCAGPATCASLACGSHSACDDSAGAATCSCEPGYADADCTACAEGFQDNDTDGSCQASCAAAALDCSGHGVCLDATGEAACSCDVGYSGVRCEDCADGFQDEDGDGACAPTCATAALRCLPRAHCSEASGDALCVCDVGQAGPDCAACDTGYQDKDGDGACQPTCLTAGLACGYGSCSDASGTAQCSCEPGYAAPDCTSCADGYQDNDHPGICAPSCALAGLDCSHGSCSDAGGTAQCACEPGYAAPDCTSCDDGYQDNGHHGTCAPTCDTVAYSCSDLGGCDDSDGTAHCLCSPGYQDHDGTGTCLPTCASSGLACINGHCEDSGGAALCACDTGYDGTWCALCAVGYQDYDGDGTCEPTCVTAALACPSHSHCDAITGQATCYCDEGYGVVGGSCTAQKGATCADALPLDLSAEAIAGYTVGAGDDYHGSCQSVDGEELVYVFSVSGPLHVSFDARGFDTVLYLRSVCGNANSELACNDDIPDMDGGSHIAASLSAGTYYLFVDSYAGSGGLFSLYPVVTCGSGQAFDASLARCITDPCQPNPCSAAHTVCKPTLPSSHSCDCIQGYVPDGGGACVHPLPDGDGCATAATIAAGSHQGVLFDSTLDANDDAQGSCGGSGPDRVVTFTLSAPTVAVFRAEGFDAVLHLRATCDLSASEIACADDVGTSDSLMRLLEPGTYYLWIDSFQDGGDYTLSYWFFTNPCTDGVCPSGATCAAAADWSTYECACAPGTLRAGSLCVADPCSPNPCTGTHASVCRRQLPEKHVCECDPGYLPSGGGSCAADPSAAEWLFVVYMNGDNNLSEAASVDLAEMVGAGASHDVQVVALYDTYDSYAVAVHLQSPGNFELVGTWGEVDMSDWKVLRDFGVFAVQRYPARHTALVLWDHGDGWRATAEKKPLLKGFSNDAHGIYGELLISRGEYARALTSITDHLGTALDLVGFDACLMSMAEVAMATAPYARVLVASEETEPDSGWKYGAVLSSLLATPTQSEAALGGVIADTYVSQSTDHATMAVTDLTKVGALAGAISAFGDALRASSAKYSSIDAARAATLAFYDPTSRDLYDFASRISVMSGASGALVSSANAVKAAVQAAVLSNRTRAKYGAAHGLAIYLPAQGEGMDLAYRDSGAVWSQTTTWDEFLVDFAR
jgi:hypothetical protein